MSVTTTPNHPSITLTTFRSILTAFADDQRYSNAAIQPWLNLSAAVMSPERWGEYRELGQALFTAHNLVLNERDERAADAGGIPGISAGILTSKSVGSVSASYDSQSGTEALAGEWNLTTYGRRFYRLMRMIGMGGTQLGWENAPTGPGFGSPWLGPVRTFS